MCDFEHVSVQLAVLVSVFLNFMVTSFHYESKKRRFPQIDMVRGTLFDHGIELFDVVVVLGCEYYIRYWLLHCMIPVPL